MRPFEHLSNEDLAKMVRRLKIVSPRNADAELIGLVDFYEIVDEAAIRLEQLDKE